MYAEFSTGSHGNLHDMTVSNKYFRKVIDTTPTQQLVLMSLDKGVEIGKEVHPYNTQFIKIESGSCIAMLENEYVELKKDHFIIIPPNTLHNIINNSNNPLKLYTIYSPPHHPSDRLDYVKPEND
jgi:mannose-6-phosphate isomerase-like protein (cupin superfamily)